VPQDFVLARRWFTASANQGDSAGMYNLGLMFELGQGMKADLPRAYAWYALAAQQGDVPAAAEHRDNAMKEMDRTERRQARSLLEVCQTDNTSCN
jgi:TPR repeat protein